MDSKFNPPIQGTALVLRESVRAAICDAPGQVVVVSAPAGFGKTTAMLQAQTNLEKRGLSTVWLTLDRADNDMSRFMNGLNEALTRLGIGGDGTDAVSALARTDASFALFLDEFETVREGAVLGLVREIVEHLPRGGHLIIGSRGSPQLGLARLRVRGLLVEVGAQQLRFSLEETRTFFERRPRPKRLSVEQLSRLHQKTEGWVAALWLSSMVLDHAIDLDDFIERFSGSDRGGAEYLAEDVLAHQSPVIQQFLLRTSLLRELDASVCAALNPRVDCAAMLEQLNTDHLFLTPVSGSQRTWRYHSLFATYLRARLEREHPDDVARLHLSASAWYESQSRPVPAIDHAIEGGDFPHAMQLLQGEAEQFLAAGRMRLLSRWFTSLPVEQLRVQPHLAIIGIWAATFTRGPWEAIEMLQSSGLEDASDPFTTAHVNGLRPLLLAMQDRNEEALQAGRAALKRLPTGHDFPDTTLLNAMAH
ncbi:MAG TPA: hypothetical protein VFI87_17480 [Hyphomicrobiaceae bacterium]|nr:hypothetical protein [Hyphomicrobiaceae bacterium]